jgi:hypothetical protein
MAIFAAMPALLATGHPMPVAICAVLIALAAFILGQSLSYILLLVLIVLVVFSLPQWPYAGL